MDGEPTTGRRVALALALAVVLGAPVVAGRSTYATPRSPNIVVIVSDDQSPESLPHDPPVMPFLQGRMEDPNDHWISFSRAFLNSPLCCPSRATILTGRYAFETGVLTNEDGDRFDDSSTVATWLHDAGYVTGLVGKYLNGYPFGRTPFVPPGWDRWAAKTQGSSSTVYYGYKLVQQGFPVTYGHAPSDYSTDVFASLAVNFIRTAPSDAPFFLYFTPTAPHHPWLPPPSHRDAFAHLQMPEPPSLNEADVSDKPAWVRALPPLSPDELASLERGRRNEYRALRGLDDAVRSIVEALKERGALSNTVIFYLTDNGVSFGEHRWTRKECPYEECVKTPFLVRMPGATPHVDGHLVSNVDLAPTIAQLAHVSPDGPVSGTSLIPLLEGRSPHRWRTGVLLEWAGGDTVPPWWGIRTRRLVYVEISTGERELYRLRSDPFELVNQAGRPALARTQQRLASELRALRRSG